MRPDTRLDELLSRYEDFQQRGQAITPEDLCRDCPELLEELRRRIGHLERIDPFLTIPGNSPPNQNAADTTTEPGARVVELRPSDEPVPGYRLLRLLGKGGFGEVWEAEGPGGFRVAFKFVRLAGRAGEFELHALEVIRNIRHPNLLSIFGTWQKEGLLIIGMELADRTLHDRFCEAVKQRLAGIPRRELLRYWQETARVIDYLNKPRHFLGGPRPVGIQHGDIKPQNLLLVGDGIKVGDYGLIRLLEQSIAEHTGGLTVEYASPEVLNGRMSHWSDQYSLALTYCRLRAGRLPFAEGKRDQPPDLTMLPREERMAVARALDPTPQQRWPSCRAFVKALVEGMRGPEEPPTELVLGSHRRPLSPGLAPAGAALTVPDAASPPVAQVDGAATTPARNVLPGGAGIRTIRRIGTGGFGEVWLGEAPGGAQVAVKIIFRPLDHEEAQRELRSLALLKNLRHSYLVETQQFWTHEDRLYIVMQLAEKSLRDRYKECRLQGLPGIPLSELIRYFRESAEAIDYLHSEHVLHRDIKPENLLLLGGHVKVADWGLARAQQQPNVSFSGSGTPAYMAPEVWKGKANEQSDLYALALTYAEMRLGRRLFPSTDYAGLMLDHLETPPDLGSLSEGEGLVLRRALAKNPAERFASCQDFVRALEQAVSSDTPTFTTVDLAPQRVPELSARRPTTALPRAAPAPGSPRRESVPRSAPRGSSRSWGVAVAGLAAGASVLLAIVLLFMFGLLIRSKDAGSSSDGSWMAIYGLVGLGLVTGVGMVFWLLRRRSGPEAVVWDTSALGSEQRPAPAERALAKEGPEDAFGTCSPLRTSIPGEMREILTRAAAEERTEAQLTEEEMERLNRLVHAGRPTRGAGVWGLGAEQRALTGHADAVWGLGVAPDSHRAISGSMDGTVRLWDLETGRAVQRLEAHADGVTSVAFSPDLRQVLSAGLDGTVRLWDAESGQESRRIEGHVGRVFAAAFSPDGRHILSGGEDRTLRLWDVATGQEVRRLDGHAGWVTSLAFSPDGRLAVSGGEDQTVRLWEVGTGREVRCLLGHTGAVKSVAFAPQGDRVATGGCDRTVRLWDIESGREIYSLNQHGDWVRCVAFSPDGRFLASGSDDETLRLWQARTGAAVKQFEGTLSSFLCVTFSPDGQHFLSGSDDGVVRVSPLPR